MSPLTALHSTFVGFTAASASGVRATLPLAIMAFAKHLGLVDLAPGTLFRQPTTTEPAHTAVAGSHRSSVAPPFVFVKKFASPYPCPTVLSGYEWLESSTASFAIPLALVAELVADKVPAVDSVLHLFATPLHAAAGFFAIAAPAGAFGGAMAVEGRALQAIGDATASALSSRRAPTRRGSRPNRHRTGVRGPLCRALPGRAVGARHTRRKVPDTWACH